MEEVAIPKVLWHLQDFHIPRNGALSILRLHASDIAGSECFMNIALNQCFRRDGPRIGGVVSIAGVDTADDAKDWMQRPYANSNCIAICTASSHPLRRQEELEGLHKLALDLGIKTKKGKEIDLTKIAPAAGIFELGASAESISYNAYLAAAKGRNILTMRFRGIYERGSRGTDAANFISPILDLYCAKFNPDGIVVDFKSLSYEFGDDISISTHKFHDSSSPAFAIVHNSQIPSFRGASIECYAMNDDEALDLMIDRIRDWTPSHPVSFLKDQPS